MHYVLQCSLRELFRRKKRTISTLLGYAIAVAASALLTLMLFRARDDSGDILKHTGTHFMAFMTGCGKKDCGIKLRDHDDGFEVNGIQVMPLADKVAAWVKELPSVKDASLFLAFRLYDSIPERRCSIGGFDPANNEAVGTTCCAPNDLIMGRFLTAADTVNTVLIHESFFRLRRYDVGDTIRLVGEPCVVVGIINPGIRPARADIYCALPLARKLVQKRLKEPDMTNQGNVILVETATSIMHDNALKTLKEEGFVTETYACYKPAATVLGMNERALVSLLVMIALMTAFFALKTQFSSVTERGREFAILQAIGWKRGTIIGIVVIESALQACAGWLAGLAITGIALLVGAVFKLPASYPTVASPLSMAATSAATLLLVLCPSVIAGLISGHFARRVKPAEVFRRP